MKRMTLAFGLDGLSALVTGGSRGLGLLLCARLAVPAAAALARSGARAGQPAASGAAGPAARGGRLGATGALALAVWAAWVLWGPVRETAAETALERTDSR